MDPIPIDLDIIKAHCRIDDTRFDDLLLIYLGASIAWAEGAMHRTIYAREHKWVLRDFPRTRYQEIRLPRGKTLSVDSIQYTRNNQTVEMNGPSSGSPAGSDYREDMRGDDGGIVMPSDGEAWPSVDFAAPAPVVITYTAGWETDQVPDDLTHALLFSVQDCLELGGTSSIQSAGQNFEVRESLISGWRLSRFY